MCSEVSVMNHTKLSQQWNESSFELEFYKRVFLFLFDHRDQAWDRFICLGVLILIDMKIGYLRCSRWKLVCFYMIHGRVAKMLEVQNFINMIRRPESTTLVLPGCIILPIWNIPGTCIWRHWLGEMRAVIFAPIQI